MEYPATTRGYSMLISLNSFYSLSKIDQTAYFLMNLPKNTRQSIMKLTNKNLSKKIVKSITMIKPDEFHQESLDLFASMLLSQRQLPDNILKDFHTFHSPIQIDTEAQNTQSTVIDSDSLGDYFQSADMIRETDNPQPKEI